jgi:hypothetical protein
MKQFPGFEHGMTAEEAEWHARYLERAAARRHAWEHSQHYHGLSLDDIKQKDDDNGSD